MAANPGYYLYLLEQSIGKETLATEEIERDLHRYYIQPVLVIFINSGSTGSLISLVLSKVITGAPSIPDRGWHRSAEESVDCICLQEP